MTYECRFVGGPLDGRVERRREMAPAIYVPVPGAASQAASLGQRPRHVYGVSSRFLSHVRYNYRGIL